jgi:outer membrane beta-barrel protein
MKLQQFKKIGVMIFISQTLAVSGAFAQAATTPEAPAAAAADSGSDKMDLKKLEDKYWSAKDTDFNVVQNRTYNKNKRVFLSVGYGPLINDAYSYGRMTNMALGYYFSERYGVEFAFEKGTLTPNSSVDAMASYNGLNPNYNKFVDYKSVNFIWVPFYAKMSFMDIKIVYFDMQFGFGMGQLTYESIIDPVQASNDKQTALGYNFDFTQQLFFSEHFAVRLDIKNKWSKQNQKIWHTTTGGPSRDSLGSINQQDTSILLGVTYFFNGKGE